MLSGVVGLGSLVAVLHAAIRSLLVPWGWSSGAARNPTSRGVDCLKVLEQKIVEPDISKVLFFLVGDCGTSWSRAFLDVGVEDCGLLRIELINVLAVLREYYSGVSSHIMSSLSSSEITQGSKFELCDSSQLEG